MENIFKNLSQILFFYIHGEKYDINVVLPMLSS